MTERSGKKHDMTHLSTYAARPAERAERSVVCLHSGRRVATYQHPPLPVERERARSAAEVLGGVLRELPCSLSASTATAEGAEDGEMGDASWTAEESISGWSDSGVEGRLLLLGDEAAVVVVSNAMFK